MFFPCFSTKHCCDPSIVGIESMKCHVGDRHTTLRALIICVYIPGALFNPNVMHATFIIGRLTINKMAGV